ncbi:Saccharopine dehydrogenase-domain-containing protein [Gloeopeniophorella convolvens]|nr:Saccharopine dehydrogenase-domain-containing protein [Gloeopeniophorella convolvens]
MVDILVIGATGFCGRHCARYVLEHRERSKYTVGLTARSRSKLASIGLPTDDSVQIFELDIEDEDAVEAAVKQAKVVLNCIGPFWLYSTPIVRACARNGVHYVDITGETPWIFDMIQKFDYLATQTGAIIVPSSAIDSVPADASVHLAAKALGHVPLGASTSAVGMSGGVPGGTLATFITALTKIPRNIALRSSRDWALSPTVGAKSPPGRFVYRLGARRGGIALFGRINRALIQRTAGLLEFARLTGAPAYAPYGPHFTYTEFAPARSAIGGFFWSLTLAATFVGLAFVPPFRWFLTRFLAPAGSGPADHTLESGSLSYVNITASDESPPRYAKTVIRGRGDPGTLLTAALVGESALALLLDERTPLAARGGVLTPMTAFGDAVIKRIEASDRFEVNCGLVDGPDGEIEENRKTR